MNIQDLSVEDQQLLNTQFDEGTEKRASATVGLVKELHENGCSDAMSFCDEMDKVAAEQAEEEKKMADEEEAMKKEEESKTEEEKTASANLEVNAQKAAAFYEKGYFDTLQKLGSERFNNELHYLVPYIEQKIANAGAEAALEKSASVLNKIKGLSQAAGKGAMGGAKSTVKGAKGAFSDLKSAITGKGTMNQKARAAGRAAGKAAIPAAAAGGAFMAGRASKD